MLTLTSYITVISSVEVIMKVYIVMIDTVTMNTITE